jgi:predicted  nucleic acid-binding Zn-ribbon protein
MEQRDGAEEVLDRLTAEEAVLTSERHDLERKRDDALADIDDAEQEQRRRREAEVAELPADLLALYEKIRAQSGTGAALLRQRRCEACHIEFPGSELAAVRAAAPDEVVRCENCRAILVRTDESGL